MTLSPDDDFAAAEFALGTLEPGERATLSARRRREPELDAAIRAWEARLSPLAEATPPIAPPADFLPAIEARIRAAAAAPTPDGVAALQARLSRWRAAAIGATGIAAALAIGFVAREATRAVPPKEFVAILQRSADAPAFVASINLAKGELSVRPVAAPPQAGKSYELWIIEPKLGAPRSLGVIDAAAVTRGARLAPFDRSVVEDATYAVTVEPEGGSPDGKPSGPPVFVGKLVPVEP
jgi:anti-sigma-K factor RskA